MAAFNERLEEIDVYLELLEAFERQIQKGPPTIGGAPITSRQQKILYSAVYLQLYNLVEATATWCVEAVSDAAADAVSQWRPADLIADLRKEWVRTIGRTHVELNCHNRLLATVDICDMILRAVPISKWAIEKGGGGNWDDYAIEEITERIGCDLRIDSNIALEAKRRIREDKGSLGLVKLLRNRLAHGELSFEDCGDNVMVVDLRDIRDRTADYLRAVIQGFTRYMDDFLFVLPEKRPYIGEGI